MRARLGHIARLVALVLFVSCLQSAALASPLASWMRTWTITGALCPKCSRDDRDRLASLKGSKLVVGADAFINPAYQDCRVNPDYTGLVAHPRRDLRAVFGGFPRAKLRSATVISGLVRCKMPDGGPSNPIARMVIDGSRAYLLDESGATILLR
jgi:hypothetical protein